LVQVWLANKLLLEALDGHMPTTLWHSCQPQAWQPSGPNDCSYMSHYQIPRLKHTLLPLSIRRAPAQAASINFDPNAAAATALLRNLCPSRHEACSCSYDWFDTMLSAS
jgi:hypothetical protein